MDTSQLSHYNQELRRMCPMKNSSKRYNDDFRKMVVELYHSG